MATVRDLVRVAVRAAEEKKAKDVKAIDIRGLSAVTDYMIIATGSSDTNVRAIAEGVREKLIEKGERPFSMEGLQEGSWVLLDYVDFVVHVFHYEKRLFFGLEELWADAKPVPVAAVAARKSADRSGAKPAVRIAAKDALPPVRRTALKPTGKKSAVPKKAAPKKAAVPRKTATAKKAAVSKSAVAPKKLHKATTSAVPKPRKALAPKRKTKG
jgi:ribosome-associated protein